LAFQTLDLRSILPFVTLYTGQRFPNIPPRSQVVFHPLAAQLFGVDAARMSQEIPEPPPGTNDVTEGEKCEAYRDVHCLKNPRYLKYY
jgi:hypothetical protein